MNAERSRLEEARTGQGPWKMWGPYLSERQWGTVREDYSDVPRLEWAGGARMECDLVALRHQTIGA